MVAQVDAARATSDYADRTDLGVRYFFSPVDTNKGPLSLATFLDRADEIGLTYNSQQDGETYTINALYSHDPSGWFISGSVGRSTSQYASNPQPIGFAGRRLDFHRHLFNISVGKYIFDTTTVALGVARDSTRATYQSMIIVSTYRLFTVNSRTGLDMRVVYLRLRHFGRFADTSYELAGTCARLDSQSDIRTTDSDGNVSTRRTDDRTSRCALDANLFPLDPLSVGAFFHRDNASPPIETTGIAIEWFAAPSLSVRFSYARSRYELPAPGQGVLVTTLPTFPPINPNPPPGVRPVPSAPIVSLPRLNPIPTGSIDTMTIGLVARF